MCVWSYDNMCIYQLFTDHLGFIILLFQRTNIQVLICLIVTIKMCI